MEQNKIFTINNLNNKFGRSRFKEFYLKRGSKGEVYGNEVSLEQYLTYTTEKPEKSAIEYYAKESESYDDALKKFVEDVKAFNNDLGTMVSLVNLYKKPLDKKATSFYHKIKSQFKDQNVLKKITEMMEDSELTFEELIQQNDLHYEKV